MNIFANNKVSPKPIKIFLKSSNSKNSINNPEEKTSNNENMNSTSEISINQILHETKLKEIEILQKELEEIDIQNESIEQDIIIAKESQKNLQEKYLKLNEEYNKENLELNKLKEINITKSNEFQRLNQIRQQQIDNTNNNNNNSNIENNDNNNGLNQLENVVSGINFLLNISRLRRPMEEENESVILTNSNNDEEEEGPSMTQEQLDSLEVSTYPRNNNSNEKCIICEFDFCYNDTLIILKCAHKFHKNCLINRLTARHSSKCPICKDSII